MLRGAYHMSDYGDSWVPMLAALRALHGIAGDEIYKLLLVEWAVPTSPSPIGLASGVTKGIYNSLFFSYGIRFQYPPMSLLPLDLMSMFGQPSKKLLSTLNFGIYCLNAGACGVLSWAVFRARNRNNGHSIDESLAPIGMAIVATIAAFLFYPLIRGPILGQIQVWIDALFTCSLICWFYNRRFCAGVLIGLACSIKPQLGLLLIWGLVWREMWFSSGMLTALAPLTLISLLRYGFQIHLDYLGVLAFLGRHGEVFFPNNSVNGILNAYFSGRNNMLFDLPGLLPDVAIVYWGTLAASIAALGLIVLPPLLRRGKKPNIADLGAAAICTVVGSPVAWEHHYGILLPLYVIALRFILARKDYSRRVFSCAVLFMSWILVANFIPFADLLAETPFRFMQAHCFFGALILLGLLFSLHDAADDVVADSDYASGTRLPQASEFVGAISSSR
jgi:alpha-1,2-mannosyltransferase